MLLTLFDEYDILDVQQNSFPFNLDACLYE